MSVRFLIVVMILFSPASQAGWLKNLCEKYLVQENPYPMAELPTWELLVLYDYGDSPDALKELLFRAQAQMLTEGELIQMSRVIERKE